MNRHYMKEAAPARLAAEARATSWRAATCGGGPTRRWSTWSSLLPMAVGSVDRLEEIPDRLRFLFDFDAGGGARRADVARGAARAGGARGDRGARARSWRRRRGSIARRSAPRRRGCKQRTGQKGTALFHPIRVALTGEARRSRARPGGAGDRSRRRAAGDRHAPIVGAASVRGVRAASGARRPFCCRGGSRDQAPEAYAVRSSRRRDSPQPMMHLRHQPGARGAARRARAAAAGRAAGRSRASTRRWRWRASWGCRRAGRRRGARARRRAAACIRAIVAELDGGARLQRRATWSRRPAPAAPLLVVLDGIEDPHNVGAILRTADAAGGHGVVRQARHAAPLDGVVGKASAGALAHVRIATVVNIARAVEELKDAGRLDDRAWPATRPSATTRSTSRCRPRWCSGRRGRGLRRLVRERCDRLVSIPMARRGGQPERVGGGGGRAVRGGAAAAVRAMKAAEPVRSSMFSRLNWRQAYARRAVALAPVARHVLQILFCLGWRSSVR